MTGKAGRDGFWSEVRATLDELRSTYAVDRKKKEGAVEKGKEVQRWADVAMFSSEPLDATTGPRVHLLAASNDPLGSIAAFALMYKGIVVRDLADVTDEQRRECFAQIRQTRLKAPFEAVSLHWMVEGVTRSLTHQMVRQRTAVFAQESLRFAVVEDDFTDRVALPPSLAGTQGDQALGAERDEEEWQRNVWDQALDHVREAYLHLVNSGMPAEDARGLLPHNVTTRLNYKTDLRNFAEHAGNRLCTQAQFEWRALWIAFAQELRRYGKTQTYRRKVEFGPDAGSVGPFNSSWQFDLIAELFRPACYLTGKCEFAAQDLDRKCRIRDRVDAFALHGIPSDKWSVPVVAPVAVREEGPRGGEIELAPIFPEEWLADPGAAR